MSPIREFDTKVEGSIPNSGSSSISSIENNFLNLSTGYNGNGKNHPIGYQSEPTIDVKGVLFDYGKDSLMNKSIYFTDKQPNCYTARDFNSSPTGDSGVMLTTSSNILERSYPLSKTLSNTNYYDCK